MGLFDFKRRDRFEEARQARKTDQQSVLVYILGSMFSVPLYFIIGSALGKYVPPLVGLAFPFVGAGIFGVALPVFGVRFVQPFFGLFSFRADEKATGRYNAAFFVYALVIGLGMVVLTHLPGATKDHS